MSGFWTIPDQSGRCPAVDGAGNRCVLPTGHTQPHSAPGPVPVGPPPSPVPFGASSSGPSPKPSSRRKWIAIGGSLVVILLLVSLASGGTKIQPSPAAGLSSPRASATQATPDASPRTNDPSEGPTDAATDQPTDEPAATESPDNGVAPAFKPIALSGRGKRVARFKIPSDSPAIATFKYNGRGNFVVWTVDASGHTTDLLVNTIGRYDGTRIFDTDDGSHSIAFKIEASGPWSAKVKPVTSARRWNGTSTIKGRGDEVLLLADGISGFATATIKHAGKENFVVLSYSPDGSELLVNEIGRFSGQVLIPDGTLLFEVQADGTWSINPD